MARMAEIEKTTRILYNGSCRICNGEIATYARYAAKHDLPMWFEDLNETDLDDWGVTRSEAERILHVRHAGEAYEGRAAYLLLWGLMPRYKPLATLFGLPGVRQVSTFLYNKILARCLFSCTTKPRRTVTRPRATLKP